MNILNRIVVFSFRGRTGHCHILKYYLAVIWRYLMGFEPLLFIGSYVSFRK